MKPYTVLLLRGPKFARYFGDAEPFGTDTYVAHVEAETADGAIKVGLDQVLKVDRRDCRESCREAGISLTECDYIPLVVLAGHAEALRWCWENKRDYPKYNLPTFREEE